MPRRLVTGPMGEGVQDAVRRGSHQGSAGSTRRKLLIAARHEFSGKGLAGGRVDEIAAQAGVNKQLVYEYFGDKKGLYLAVVAQICDEIACHEHGPDIEGLPPEQALATLVGALFDYFEKNVGILALLNGGDCDDGMAFKLMLSSPARLTSSILRDGQRAGIFRKGIDPAQLFISLAGISHFFFSNTPTLSAFFGKDFSSRPERLARREHVIELVLYALRP
ncbi:TetR/AcrR family transcriptional regulator [Bradyrhizobium sp.]|uniref:TetR/AcrR family transcriptional regulator n=1 Tax=Bradyrhizobium sp. TaxID=376 RepID=UPI0039E248C0